VTSLDAESARHNRSSWQWSFVNMGRGAVSRRALWAVGFVMRTIMSVREKAELGGPVYTAVFRVHDSGAPE
jgi:hypothetical protein